MSNGPGCQWGTMFVYIPTSTSSRAHTNGSTGVTIHGHIFVFDSTRLVHVQEDRLNNLRPSGNHNIFIYKQDAFHTALINTFIDTRFELISTRMLSLLKFVEKKSADDEEGPMPSTRAKQHARPAHARTTHASPISCCNSS